MKKVLLNLFLFASISTILISCEGATTEPVGSVVKEINIVEPAVATNLALSADFATQPATTIKWSGADFGYSAAVKYTLQIALASDPDYASAKSIDLGSFNENSNLVHEFPLLHKDLNLILTDLGGIIGNSVNFKMKIVGNPDVQLTDPTDPSAYPNALYANSQEVIFSASVYDKFDETLKIYVPGNFGSTSTFADWNVDVNGTSNSPAIYKPLETSNEYSGFVYMNNAVPQFKFANPDGTNLNIKGFDKIDNDPLIVSPKVGGILKDITDINDPSNITIPFTTANFSGAGIYYITADLVLNKYTYIKRKFTLSGPAVNSNPVKDLTFVTDPASPYYRMYANNNIRLVAGFFKIGLRSNSPVSPAAESLGTSLANTNQNLVITPDASSSINNKMSIGGGFYNVQNPGTYTVVLDTKNSANYNLRIIPN